MFLLLMACQGDLMVVKKDAELYEGDESGECSDNADNDQDGFFDCDDEGCSGSEDCLEDTDNPDTGEYPTDPDTSEPEDSGTPSDPLDIDNDGDGFSENQGDCDDTNAYINPDASEIAGDGIDQNCDGIDPQPLESDYTTPGEHSFVVPTGVNQITVKMWGAGGAGGTQLVATGGGGAFVSFAMSVSEGETYTVMVGEGGPDEGDGGGASLIFGNYGSSGERLWAVAAGGGGGASDGNSGNSWTGGKGGAGGYQQGQSGASLGVHQNGTTYAYCESATAGTGASQSLGGLGGSYIGTANGCNGTDGAYLQAGSVTSSGSGSSFTCNTNSSSSTWQSASGQSNGGGGAGGSGYYGGGSGGFVWTYCGGGGGGGSSYTDAGVTDLTHEAGQDQIAGNSADAQGAGQGGERSYDGASESGSNGRIVIGW